MLKITVAIITYNEEERIRKCLESAKSVADEILVIDSFSTDNTEQICKEYGARFIKNEFKGHIEQKNYALKEAAHQYVLSLDADESLSREAIEAVNEIKSSSTFSGYTFNRLTNYCGKWIRHSGWYPDRKLRFVDRELSTWTGENPHDKLEMNGDPERLNVDILHYSFPSISSHAKTADNFSSIAAKQGFLKGKNMNFFIHIILNPAFTFFKKYVIQQGFRDGFYGYVIAVISAYANFLKYTKLWQLYRENNHIKN